MNWEIAAMLGFVGFTYINFYIAMSLDEEHFLMKLFFFFTGFFTMLMGASTLNQVLDSNSAPQAAINSASGFYWLLTFITTVLFLYMIYYAFKIHWKDWKSAIMRKVSMK